MFTVSVLLSGKILYRYYADIGNCGSSAISWVSEILKMFIYSGCQKNVPLSKRFFLQPLMPQSFIPEHFYGKGYIKEI